MWKFLQKNKKEKNVRKEIQEITKEKSSKKKKQAAEDPSEPPKKKQALDDIGNCIILSRSNRNRVVKPVKKLNI